jgi:mRNA interferase YafQ
VDESVQARLPKNALDTSAPGFWASRVQAGNVLANDGVLTERYRDHALAGEYTGHRECHLKPDLLLIYKKPDAETLRFVRLGTHSELF